MDPCRFAEFGVSGFAFVVLALTYLARVAIKQYTTMSPWLVLARLKARVVQHYLRLLRRLLARRKRLDDKLMKELKKEFRDLIKELGQNSLKGLGPEPEPPPEPDPPAPKNDNQENKPPKDPPWWIRWLWGRK